MGWKPKRLILKGGASAPPLVVSEEEGMDGELTVDKIRETIAKLPTAKGTIAIEELQKILMQPLTELEKQLMRQFGVDV